MHIQLRTASFLEKQRALLLHPLKPGLKLLPILKTPKPRIPFQIPTQLLPKTSSLVLSAVRTIPTDQLAALIDGLRKVLRG